MNRQMRRRFSKSLSLHDKEIDNMAEYFRKENEDASRQVVVQFLALTVEALRLEFGFGQSRIDRYGARVNSLLDSVNLGYVSFEDLLAEMSIRKGQLVRIGDDVRKRFVKGA